MKLGGLLGLQPNIYNLAVEWLELCLVSGTKMSHMKVCWDQNRFWQQYNRLTKEFYFSFWDNTKDIFINSLKELKSQWQVIIKLLEKLNKDKKNIGHWKPISLLNFDLKITSKSLATRVNKVFVNLIGARKTPYVNKRFISKNSHLIDDVITVCDLQKNKRLSPNSRFLKKLLID